MKLIEHFNTFLDEQVNLNRTRIDQLTASVDAVKSTIRGSDWEPRILSFDAHGSWAHGTIIKPLGTREFDADLLVIVEPVEGWEAKDYVNSLGAVFDSHSTYRDKVRRYSHCVTIEYAGVRRIDIAPCVRGRIGNDTYEVCNRTSNSYEATAALAYTRWVVGRNGVAGGNDLKKVTRLLKYLRDIKTNFTCPSFLFTTLVGMHIHDSDSGTAAFADTPSCLKALVGRLDDWLQVNATLPEIRNPVLWNDVQSSAWNQTQYSNFRNKINLYRGWIDDAYSEQDRDESIGKWQRVFGEIFAAGEAKESSKLSEAVVAGNETFAMASRSKDLVDNVIALGKEALPVRITKLPYVRRPEWRVAPTSFRVNVTAEMLTSRYGTKIRSVVSLEPLQKGRGIRFTASTAAGMPFDHSFEVQWRITNTDRAAYDAGVLRGDFYPSNSGTSRAEELTYRGVHFVEAFLIGTHDKRLYGKSDPFYVVVE